MSTAWSYTLPATTNFVTNGAVTISVSIPDSASSFLAFNDTDKKLEISDLQDEDNTAIPTGQYVVDIALDDGNGGSASYQITLAIQEAPN